MKQAVGDTLNRRHKDEVNADMSESAGDGCATRVHLGRAAAECDQDRTDSGPNRLQSLTGGDESDSPTDENWRTEINQPADAKIEDREPIYSDERRIGSRQKDLPTRPQN